MFRDKPEHRRGRGVGAVCRPRHSGGRAVVIHRGGAVCAAGGAAAPAPTGCRCPSSSTSRRRARRPPRRRASAGCCRTSRATIRARRSHRHDVARRDGFDQSGSWVNRRGIFGRGSPAGDRPRLALDLAAEMDRVARGTAHRARHRREQPVHAAGGARSVGAAVWHAAAADWHGLRSVHLPRTRCAELRVLSGRAVHPGGHARPA